MAEDEDRRPSNSLALRVFLPILSAAIPVAMVLFLDPTTPAGLRGFANCREYLILHLAFLLHVGAAFVAGRFAVTGKGLYWWIGAFALSLFVTFIGLSNVGRACG